MNGYVERGSDAGELENLWLVKALTVARFGHQPCRAARIVFLPVCKIIMVSPWFPTFIRTPTVWGVWSGSPTSLRPAWVFRCKSRRTAPFAGPKTGRWSSRSICSLTPIEKVDWSDRQAVVMVDSQPKTGRHSFNGEATIYGVIDHHQTPGDLDGVPFLDIRRGVGATCSLVTRYLNEQEIGIPEHVATSLYYGIETELSGYPREASALDDIALQTLYPAHRQGLSRKNQKRSAARSLFRDPAAGAAKLLHLRQTAHQLDQRPAEPRALFAGRRFFDSARGNSVGDLCRRTR